MRILLLNPPGDKLYSRDKYCTSISKSDYYWPAIDLLVLSGICSQEHEVYVIDAIMERWGEVKTRKKIREINPEVIIFVTCSASWKSDFHFVKKIKEKLGCLLIASGGFLLFKDKEALQKYSFLDAVLLDFTSFDILFYLNKSFKKIKTVSYRLNGKIICQKKTKFSRQFSYPVPRHELFPLRKYVFPLQTKPVYTCVIASLGCPYSCSFCIPGTLGYKKRRVDNVIDELKYIKSLKINEVLFQDSTFTVDQKHTEDLCRAMIKNNLNISWICLSRVDVVNKKILKLMKEAGCLSIQFGVESGNEEILKKMNKRITKSRVRKTFNLCREAGIKTNGFFILGIPGETEKTILETIDFAKELNPDVASFSLAMPHFGTKMGEEVEERRLVKGKIDQYDDATIPIIETDYLSKEKVKNLRLKAYREFYFRPSFILRKVFSIKTVTELKINFKEFLGLIKRSLLKYED